VISLLNPTDKDAAESFARRLQPISLRELVESVNSEEFIASANLTQRQYKIQLIFKSDYQDVLKKFCCKTSAFTAKLKGFPKAVENAVKRQQKTKVAALGVDQPTSRPDGEYGASSRRGTNDDDDDGGGDAVEDEGEDQKKQESDYEDMEDEQERRIREEGEKEAEVSDQDERPVDSDEEDQENEDAEDEAEEEDESAENDSGAVIDKVGLTFIIRIPLESKKVLMVSIVEKVLETFLVKSIHKIHRAMVVEPDDNVRINDQRVWAVQTEGVNFKEIFKFAEVDVPKTTSNDIHAVLHVLGVEAARALIISEIASVFKVYDISVDYRHLNLIADHMTSKGRFDGMNRHTMASAPSPFQQMSFESGAKYLSAAAIHGDVDMLGSPSARIMVGGCVRSGTGAFSVGVPLLPRVVERM